MLPVTTFFWRFCFNLRTCYKELIWWTTDPNVHIHTVHKHWSFIWVKVFKNGSSKICGRQPLKHLSSTKFTCSILEYFVPFEGAFSLWVFLTHFSPVFAFRIETGHLICTVNQLNGFFSFFSNEMEWDCGLKWAKMER